MIKSMKIEDSKSNKVERASAKPKLGGDSDGSLFASILSAAEEVDNASSVISSNAIDSAGAIFATQVAEDATARRARNIRAAKKGESLLEKLERIRVAMVFGTISKDSIIALGQALREKREVDIDPELSKILDEIELRVEVELAKLSML